mgnify:CR=1 FL=1
MSSESFPVGGHLIARGPYTAEGKPDVDGIIVGVRDDGKVLVQEDGYDTPTVITTCGGWLSIMVAGVAIVGIALR